MELLYYVFFIALSLWLCNLFNSSKLKSKIFLALVISFFLAIREIPGDNIQYQNAYLGLLNREYEFGWAFLITLFQRLGFHLVVYKWLAIYFLQILFFILSVRKEWYHLVPLIMLLYLCMGGIEMASNIMRQWLAACIGMFSFSLYLSDFTKKQKYFIFIFIVILASLFHKSAISLLLAPIIFKLPYLDRKIQILIFISTFFLSGLFVNLWLFLSSYLNTDDFTYNWYFNQYELQKVELSSGLGQFWYLFEAVVIAWFSRKMLSFYNSKQLKSLYKLYIVGMGLFFLFHSFTDMMRLALFFQIVQILIIPLTVYYLYKNRYPILAVLLVVMRIILFLQLTVKDEIFGVTPIKFLI